MASHLHAIGVVSPKVTSDAASHERVLRGVVLVEHVARSKRRRLSVARADVPASFERHDELRRRAEVPGVFSYLLRDH